MKSSSIALIAAAIGLAFVFASPAEAAKRGKHKKSGSSAYAMTYGYAARGSGFQGGVLAGPLYNGQDYLGNDPDPNIRAYLLRDLSGRYGGGR